MPYVRQPNGSYRWVEPQGSGLAPLQEGQVRVMTGGQRLAAAGIDPTTAREGDPGLSRQQNAALFAMGRSDEAAMYENNGGQYGSALTDALRGRTVNRGPQPMGRSLVQGGTVGARMQGAQPMQGGQTMQPGVQPGQAALAGGMAAPRQMAPGVQPGQGPAQQGMAQAAPMQGGGMPGGGINFGQTSSGVAGAEQAMQGGLRGGLGLLMQGTEQARRDLMQAGQGANNTLNPFYAPGQQSNEYQAALSGALGNQAQQHAMDSFMGSPGQQYLLNESERAIRRNAAATGGLGGGNVQRALQENAIGLAAQDFGNAFNRLGTVSDRGLAAGRQISGNAMTTGAGLANLTNQNANTGAGMIYGTGNQIGAGRNRAGEMIAGNIQGTSGNLANLMYGTGQDMSNAIGSGASQLIQALQVGGASDAEVLMAYANALAGNTQTGASTFTGQQGLGSTQNVDGFLTGRNSSDMASIINGVGGAIRGIGGIF